MKFLIIIVIICLITSNGQETAPSQQDNQSDAAFNRIEDIIKKMAEALMKSSDVLSKRKKAGSLPDGYPDQMKKDAEGTRDNKNEWNPVMNEPTDMHRVCIYPNDKVNYHKYCKNTFTGMKNKEDGRIC
jgi:hypothetical protein